MSERGSFITEYIYCSKCLEHARNILLRDDKELCSQQVLSWESHPQPTAIPIIAGKVGSSYKNGEIHLFEDELIPLLVERICHAITIAVLPESGKCEFIIASPKSLAS
jgi:hypothetical protein